MGLVVKNPPAYAEDIRDVGSIPESGDPLEEEMATHSSNLAGNLMARGVWWVQSTGLQRAGHN